MPPHQTSATDPPSPLLSLPTALLETIMPHLDTVSLASLHRTCWRLNIISARPLYRTIILKPDQSMSLVISLTRNTHLREFVESLTVHDHHTIDTVYAEALAPVIAMLGNLRSLCIKGCYTRTQSLLRGQEIPGWRTLYLPALQSPFLTRLESCDLSFTTCETWPISSRECIFLHPSLKTLSILGASIASFTTYTEQKNHTTQLQELALLCCDLSADTLCRIVSMPRALRRFTMAGARQIGGAEYTDTMHDRYFRALLPQAHSLRNLQVGLWNFKYGHNPRIDLGAFGVLEQFTFTPLMLPPVQGHFRYLTPFSQIPFPESLRGLTLFHIEASTFSIVERMVLVQLRQLIAGGNLPNLVSVVFATPVFSGLYAGRDLALPHGWEQAFEGRVRVQRVGVGEMKQFPVKCACCDYHLGRWVVNA